MLARERCGGWEKESDFEIFGGDSKFWQVFSFGFVVSVVLSLLLGTHCFKHQEFFSPAKRFFVGFVLSFRGEHDAFIVQKGCVRPPLLTSYAQSVVAAALCRLRKVLEMRKRV